MRDRERRRHQRHTFVGELHGERLTPVHAGSLRFTGANVGPNGMMLFTDFGFYLSTGDRLNLRLVDADMAEGPVEIMAKIIWIQHLGFGADSGRWVLGVSFEAGQEVSASRLCELAKAQGAESNDGGELNGTG